MKKLYCIILLLAIVAAPAFAQQNASQKSRRDKLEKEIEILNAQLKANASKSTNALSRLTLTRRKLTARKELLSQSQKMVRAYEDSVSLKRSEIRETQRRLDTMSVYYSKLVKSAYKNRDPRIWYMYILSGDSFGQFFHRYSYLKNLSGKMNERARKIKYAQEELNLEMQDLNRIKAEAKKVSEKHEKELNLLKNDEASARTIVTQLSQEKTKYQKQLAQKKKQVEALNREINRLVSSKSKTKVDTKLSVQFEANKGRLPWPVEGSVVDSYGQHYHPVYTRVKLPFNNGVTIATAPDAKVQAVFDGEVKQVIVMPGYNQCVLVQHGAYFTFYCKLKSVSVKAGNKISTGQKIGTVDTINGETQLHFQLWNGKQPQDPENWLR